MARGRSGGDEAGGSGWLAEPVPSLRGLALAVAVAEQGGLGAAARALGVSQPSASGLLAQLEGQLGVRLFERGPRGTVPSEAGRQLLPMAETVVRAVGLLQQEARLVGAAEAPELRVAASTTVAEHLAPRWLGRLAAGREDLRLVLEVANSTGVARSVREGRAELGFVEGPAPDAVESLAVEAIGRDRLVVVVPPGHPWAGQGEVEATDLAQVPLVLREPGSGTREALEEAMGRLGLAVRARLTLGSGAAVLAAVRHGDGPGVVSELVAAEAVAAGSLVALGVRGVALERRLWAIWRRQPGLSSLARTLLAQVAADG
jgi:DNA-binding transcriptional LysR family regulator